MYAFSLFTGQFWILTPFIVCAPYPDTPLNCCSHLLLDWIHCFSFPFSQSICCWRLWATPRSWSRRSGPWSGAARCSPCPSSSLASSNWIPVNNWWEWSWLVSRRNKKSHHTTPHLYIFYFFTPQFIYVNQSFAPSPDQDVGVLFDVSTHTDLHLIARKWIRKRAVFFFTVPLTLALNYLIRL